MARYVTGMSRTRRELMGRMITIIIIIRVVSGVEEVMQIEQMYQEGWSTRDNNNVSTVLWQ